MTALSPEKLAEIKTLVQRHLVSSAMPTPQDVSELCAFAVALIAEVEGFEEVREVLAEESAGRAWAWDNAKGWKQRAETAEAAVAVSRDLLREAAELIDALDLGVESDGCAALVRRIDAHLAAAPAAKGAEQ